MDERVLQFRVGIVVLAAVIITIILVILFGAMPRLLKPQYTVSVRFPRAPGVAVNTPVRKSGVSVGRVSNVELLPEGGVLLTLKLDADKPVRLNEYCRISTGSLISGDAVLEFIRDRDDPRDEPLNDGDYLPNGQVESDPMRVIGSLEERMLLTLDSIQSTSEKAGNFLDQLQWVGENQDQVRRILQRTEEGLTSFNTAMQDFDSLVGDQQLRDDLRKTMADLSRSATELSDVMGEAKATFGELRKTAEGFQQVSEKAEQQLENLNGFTEPLRDNGEQIVNSINSSLRNLDELLAQVVYLTRAINNREGTLGKLVYETEVYDQINRAVGNVEGITRQLKPIVSDVRVFTDKIARDPRQLGARGLLERKPTGLKSGLPGGSAVPPGSTPWH